MDVDVAVVGAGVSGLTVARQLGNAGRTVHVFEARDRVGGRAFSPRVGDHPVDLGASWVWDHERHVHDLLAALALDTYEPWAQGLGVAEQRGQRITGRFPQSHSPERRVVGGAGAIAAALAAHVPDLHLATPVTAIEPLERGVRVHTEHGATTAAVVVAALPPALLARRIELTGLDERAAELYRHVPVWMGDVAKVVAVYDTPWWRDAGWSGRAVSDRGPMVEVHELSGPRDDPAALFGFVPRAWAAEGLEERVVDQLGRLFGAASPAPRTVVVQRWWTERFTFPDDGQSNEAVRLFGHPGLQQPQWDGRLHVVSAETSAASPGHLDGAIERAVVVSQRIEQHLGRSPQGAAS